MPTTNSTTSTRSRTCCSTANHTFPRRRRDGQCDDGRRRHPWPPEEARRYGVVRRRGNPAHAGATAPSRPSARRCDSRTSMARRRWISSIARAQAQPAGTPLVLLPIGKLTNIALALARVPGIAKKVRIRGGSAPPPRRQASTTRRTIRRYSGDVCNSVDVPFEMVVAPIRDAASHGRRFASRQTTLRRSSAGRGPAAATPVMGRHGEAFTTFGDYSVNLFAHIRFDCTPPSAGALRRGAAAILKNPLTCGEARPAACRQATAKTASATPG